MKNWLKCVNWTLNEPLCTAGISTACTTSISTTHHFLYETDELNVAPLQLNNLLVDARNVALINIIQRLEGVTGMLQGRSIGQSKFKDWNSNYQNPVFPSTFVSIAIVISY